ncbi:MAG: hypothetical protein ACI4HZ_06635 [Ruminococcus sp.]
MLQQIVIAKQNGFEMQFICNVDNVEISTDALILKRVFDNIFSNIYKYANKQQSVKINVTADASSISIVFVNYIDKKETGLKAL